MTDVWESKKHEKYDYARRAATLLLLILRHTTMQDHLPPAVHGRISVRRSFNEHLRKRDLGSFQ